MYTDVTSKTKQQSIKPFSLLSDADHKKMPADLDDAYPLTSMQAGMIYHSMINPNAYHVVDNVILKCDLKLDILVQLVNRAIDRHPILRTSFDTRNYSEPLQLVFHPSVISLKIRFDDWSNLTEAQQKVQLNTWLKLENS